MSMPSAGPSTTAQYAPSDGPSSANSLLNPRVAPSAPQMRYATTNGSSSLAYYQPSDAGDSGVRDGRSTGAASVSTAISTSTSTGTSTNVSAVLRLEFADTMCLANPRHCTLAFSRIGISFSPNQKSEEQGGGLYGTRGPTADSSSASL